MYSPNFNITNTYELWDKQKPELVQPPLSAYSSEFPGVTNYQSNYPYSLSTQIKLNRLNQIKYFGYKSLKPIGINKTMEQMDHENNALEANMTTTLENDVIDPNLQRDLDVDVDLDDSIPNFDSDADLNLNEEEDEGFMAEEVEYQNDHSLGTSTIGNAEAVGGIPRTMNLSAQMLSEFHGTREEVGEEDDEVEQPIRRGDDGSGAANSANSVDSWNTNNHSTATSGPTLPASIETRLTEVDEEQQDCEQDMILDDLS